MMKLRPIFIVVALAFGSAMWAQQRDKSDSKPVQTIRIDTDLITIDVTVTDKNGNYVRDLSPDEFQVFEDGKPKKLDFFAVTDETTLSRPLAVVFALDLSGSLKPEEIKTLREAALKFTELMQGESVFAALTFNYKVKILQDFTDNPAKLEKALAKTDRVEGSTRIYDAIDRAVTMMTRKAPRSRKNRPVRRVVVVISDGFDSTSIIDRNELIRRASEAGVTVYSMTLPSYILSPTQSTQRVITPFDASRIVAATGGRDFSADANDFSPIFKSLAEEIRASYALAFYPEQRDGKFHDVRVKTSRQGVQLRTSRSGYVAPNK
ncbi:MAG: VWA domain-containing protein [Acidobacteriota bacterium]|nr:VWA domain-containing protein [Acidobacteriota bacterium]